MGICERAWGYAGCSDAQSGLLSFKQSGVFLSRLKKGTARLAKRNRISEDGCRKYTR